MNRGLYAAAVVSSTQMVYLREGAKAEAFVAARARRAAEKIFILLFRFLYSDE
jgi:hypothetical protein